MGVDGVTKEQYGQDFERNLEALHARLAAGRYRRRPIRRAHIAKEGGKTRPIGISAFEDKVVQDAAREALEAIYAQDSCLARAASDRSATPMMRFVPFIGSWLEGT